MISRSLKGVKLRKGGAYRFEWNDTYANHGWFDDEQVRENTLLEAQQVSVGFLVQEIGDWYVIARHRNAHATFPPWGDLCWLPKGSVVRITALG